MQIQSIATSYDSNNKSINITEYKLNVEYAHVECGGSFICEHGDEIYRTMIDEEKQIIDDLGKH